jgi:N-acetylglucosamine-6-sulfatase
MIRFTSSFTFMVLLAVTSVAQTDSRPNIVVVLVDDMRWDEYGAFGHAFIKTPNIDRIANEGVTFTNAFCTTPLCSPSRANFLTGQYAHNNGITDNTARDQQSHQLNTFPGMLDDSGYETAFIGKWHMGNDDSRRPGWDFWVSMKGQGEATDPLLNMNGEQKQVKGYVTDILTDQSLVFIGKKRSQPFLLYLSHKALHPNIQQHNDGSTTNIGEGEFVAADRHKGMYTAAYFKRRPNHAIVPADKPALMRKIADLPPLGSETATTDQTIRDRSEMLMAVDESLGRIMSALVERNLLGNTIIVFTSDHGYWYGEHGLNDERRLAYEESIRIPLLIRYPAMIKPGISIDKYVQSIDLAPTLLDFAGITPPRKFDGMNIVPLLQNKQVAWRSSILVEYYSDIVFPRIQKMGYKAIRTDRYKFIRYEELSNMNELYDLQQDPYELNNLIKKTGSDTITTRLNEELDRLLK